MMWCIKLAVACEHILDGSDNGIFISDVSPPNVDEDGLLQRGGATGCMQALCNQPLQWLSHLCLAALQHTATQEALCF